MIYRKNSVYSLALFASAVAVSISGCGAGTANIPASLPPPTKIGGPNANAQKLEDIAKAKGLVPPESKPKMPANFNPTNPNPTNSQ